MMGEESSENPPSGVGGETIEQNPDSPSSSDIDEGIKTISDPHDSALDGGILLNLIAESNIYYATKGAINEGVAMKHKTCQIPLRMPSGTQNHEIEEACCVDEKGCSKAISMGYRFIFHLIFSKMLLLWEKFTAGSLQVWRTVVFQGFKIKVRM